MKFVYPAIVALALFFSTCRNKQPSLSHNTLFVFTETTDTVYCREGLVSKDRCSNGELYLTTEGKALLYRFCGNDTVRYHRGTYSVADSNVNCLFDSELIVAGKSPQPKNKFKDMARYSLALTPARCEFFTLKTQAGESGLVKLFREADSTEMPSFCDDQRATEFLADFRCMANQTPHAKRKKGPPLVVINQMIDYYKAKNTKAKMQKTENDSVVSLSFTSTKRSRDNDGTPYLFVTIKKSSEGFLQGDLTGDGVSDILALPVLSQGGSTSWQDLFLFIKDLGKLKVRTVLSTMDVARCPRGSYNGIFYPEEIRDGAIFGYTECYTDDDEQCCPSVRLECHVLLKDNKFRQVKN